MVLIFHFNICVNLTKIIFMQTVENAMLINKIIEKNDERTN